MTRKARVAITAIGILLAVPLEAQKAQIFIDLPEASRRAIDPPSIRSQRLLTDGSTVSLLHNGFPARLHYRVERWTTGGWFDDIAADTEWDVVVRYDALGKVFQVYRAVRKKTVSLGTFADIEGAEAAVDAPFTAPVGPPRKGQRTYYNATVDIEALSLTELDEVERWLRGELKPAVRGQKNPGTAVGRGVRTVMVRLLGGEKRKYEVRSGTFRP